MTIVLAALPAATLLAQPAQVLPAPPSCGSSAAETIPAESVFVRVTGPGGAPLLGPSAIPSTYVLYGENHSSVGAGFGQCFVIPRSMLQGDGDIFVATPGYRLSAVSFGSLARPSSPISPLPVVLRPARAACLYQQGARAGYFRDFRDFPRDQSNLCPAALFDSIAQLPPNLQEHAIAELPAALNAPQERIVGSLLRARNLPTPDALEWSTSSSVSALSPELRRILVSSYRGQIPTTSVSAAHALASHRDAGTNDAGH